MSTPMTMMNCPDDNTLAAYIDGRLDPAARQRVVEHLSTCEACYANVSAVWDYQADQAESTNVVKGPFRSTPAWTWAAAAAAAIILIVVALPAIRGWVTFQRTGGMSAVIDAQKSLDKRPMEGRLAELEYKPYDSPTRGDLTEPLGDEKKWQLMVVAEDLKKRRASSAQELRALAAAQLFIGERDEAILALERAAAATPNDPVILNDLAVAYLERQRWRSDRVDAGRAMSTLQRAWQLAQTPEIAFNRALAFEANHQDADAIRAWQAYLAMDSSSEWAADARERLNTLQQTP